MPYSNLVSFAVTQDLKDMIFATGRNTRKYRNIARNADVSLLIDNRTNRPADITQAVAVTAIGTAVIEPDNIGRLHAIFLARHPQLEQFVNKRDTATILVHIREYIISSFDKTRRVVI